MSYCALRRPLLGRGGAVGDVEAVVQRPACTAGMAATACVPQLGWRCARLPWRRDSCQFASSAARGRPPHGHRSGVSVTKAPHKAGQRRNRGGMTGALILPTSSPVPNRTPTTQRAPRARARTAADARAARVVPMLAAARWCWSAQGEASCGAAGTPPVPHPRALACSLPSRLAPPRPRPRSVRANVVANREVAVGDAVALTSFSLYKQISSIVMSPGFEGPRTRGGAGLERGATGTLCGIWVQAAPQAIQSDRQPPPASRARCRPSRRAAPWHAACPAPARRRAASDKSMSRGDSRPCSVRRGCICRRAAEATFQMQRRVNLQGWWPWAYTPMRPCAHAPGQSQAAAAHWRMQLPAQHRPRPLGMHER
eukprot:366501-Chlamydomonas_euryale.AAC.37